MTQLTLNQTTLLGATTGTVQSLLLPTGGRQLLLPEAAVAEVLDNVTLTPLEGAADWHLGFVKWEDQDIPVYSFERLNSQELPRASSRVAIINALNSELSAYGILLQGLPRNARVKIAELEDLESAPTGPVEFLQVRYAGELAVIPDLDALEAAVIAA